MGSVDYSIDVNKKHLTEVKDLYKALLKIGEMTSDNDVKLSYAKDSLELASTTLNRVVKHEIDTAAQLKALNEEAFSWLVEAHKQYKPKDFGAVFERYINQ